MNKVTSLIFSKNSILIWVISLAFLSVGLRNFEKGLNIDAPLYASIARNIADGSSAWALEDSIPEFEPYFAEHPHLGFWIMSAFLRILPDEDWAIRVPSHLFYILFLLLLFYWIRQKTQNDFYATIAVVALWTFPRFSNFHSTAYLDPYCLLFGSLSVYLFDRLSVNNLSVNKIAKSALLSGLFLAAAFMSKGLTALAFGPVLAYLTITRKMWKEAIVCLAGTFLVLGIYYVACSVSAAPDFFEVYFSRQWSGRFSQSMDFSKVFSSKYFSQFFKESNYVIVLGGLWLCFQFLRNKLKKTNILIAKNSSLKAAKEFFLTIDIPVILFASFWAMYAPNGRIGLQYWLMLLPWVAWIFGGMVAFGGKFNDGAGVRRITKIASIVLVCLLQYIPFRAHYSYIPEGSLELKHFLRNDVKVKADKVKFIYMPDLKEHDSFKRTGLWSWYTGLHVGPYMGLGDWLKRKDLHGESVYVLGKGVKIADLETNHKGLCVVGRGLLSRFVASCNVLK